MTYPAFPPRLTHYPQVGQEVPTAGPAVIDVSRGVPQVYLGNWHLTQEVISAKCKFHEHGRGQLVLLGMTGAPVSTG